MIAKNSIIIDGVLYRRGQDVGKQGNRESGKEAFLGKEGNRESGKEPCSLEEPESKIEPAELPKLK